MLLSFKEASDNPFFDAIIYGLTLKISEGKVLDKKRREKLLEKIFTLD